MKIIETELPGVLVIEPDVYDDDRGFFYESWNLRKYSDQRLPRQFVQDNVSFSKKGVLRGLHFQNPHPQGKLVSVLEGEVFDVVVDIRVGSPTFGKWLGTTVSSDNKRQLYIPEGFAHGFLITSEVALFFYKCTDFYNSQTEWTLLWNDPELAIEWPLKDPIVSPKDSNGTSLRAIIESSTIKMNSLKEQSVWNRK